MWGLVHALGGIQALGEIDGWKAHRLSNGLTLELNAHSEFDALQLWFEEDSVSTILFHNHLLFLKSPTVNIRTGPRIRTGSVAYVQYHPYRRPQLRSPRRPHS